MGSGVQRAGDTFADLVYLLMPLVDIVKGPGIGANIISVFNVKKLTDGSGYILSAGKEEAGPLVQIWGTADDGSAKAMTETNAIILKEDLAVQGKLVAGTRSYKSYSPKPLLLFLLFSLILLQ
jgi:hypothetical protein